MDSAAASGRLDDAQAAALGTRAASSVLRECGGWRRMLRTARAEGLLPLVGLAIRSGRFAPPAGAAVPAAPGRLQTLVPVVIQAGAESLARSLDGEGIAHAFIKGIASAPRYGRLWLRPMSDVDVLVSPADFARARALIAGLGYAECYEDEMEATFAPKAPDDFRVTVDLHRDVHYTGIHRTGVDDMLSRARAARGGGGAVRTLAPEDEILVLAAHAARSRMHMVGRSMCDVAVLTLTESVCWDTVVRRSREWRLAVAVWAALSCARRAFGAPVPAEATGALRPAPHHEAFVRLWLDLARVSPYRLGRRALAWPSQHAAMLVVWPALADGLLAGAWYVARFSVRTLARKLRASGS